MIWILGTLAAIYVASRYLKAQHASKQARMTAEMNRIDLENAESTKRAQEKMRLAAQREAEGEAAAVRKKSLELEIHRNLEHAHWIVDHFPRFYSVPNEKLDEASTLFEERLYYPFWDKIEEALRCLTEVRDFMQSLEKASVEHIQKVKEYGAPTPAFPVSENLMQRMAVFTPLSERARQMVELAHKDHQFASIYAARRTNSALESGFSNMLQSLSDITVGIGDLRETMQHGFVQMAQANLALAYSVTLLSDSITDLSDRVDYATNAIVSANSALTSTISDVASQIEFMGETIGSANRDSIEREKTAIEMLDRIQRHETPPPRWLPAI